MIAKWLRKRETKRIQAHCPHEWHSIGRYYTTSMFSNSTDRERLYCPVCDAEKDIVRDKAVAILNRQKIRKQYEEGGR